MREGWTYRKFGEICESDLGKTLNQSKDIGDLCPYLCAVNIQWDHVDLATLKTARFSDIDKQKYSVKKGDLLVCEGGDIGRAAIWDKDGTMQYQNALHRIRFIDHTYCPRFYLAYLRYLKNKGVLDSRYGKGVTIQHLVKSSLLSIPVPVPSLPEQERIVAELDLLTGIIDKQKAQLKELDTLAQSIFYDMFGDPVENEKGWNIKEIGQIAKVKTGPFGSMLHKDDYVSEGIPLVNPVHMRNYIIAPDSDFTVTPSKANELSEYLLHTGDVVFARRGDIGRCAVVFDKEDGFLCGTGSLFVRFDIPISSIFLMYVIRAESFKNELVSRAKGATMLNLNAGIISKLKVPIPPEKTQESFAQKIQSIESQKASINCSIAETRKLFDYTMDKYFG